MTTKEEKEQARIAREERERIFPYAVTDCPKCKAPIHFKAGESEIKHTCGATIVRGVKRS